MNQSNYLCLITIIGSSWSDIWLGPYRNLLLTSSKNIWAFYKYIFLLQLLVQSFKSTMNNTEHDCGPHISKTTMNFCMRWAFQAQRKRRNGLVKGGRGNDLLKEAVICSSLFNLHTFMLFKILYNIFLTPNFLHGTPSPWPLPQFSNIFTPSSHFHSTAFFLWFYFFLKKYSD